MIINEKTDKTLTALVKFLNFTYGSKQSGKKFTPQDVQQYVRRGKLPECYGGKRLRQIEKKGTGIKFIRIT